MNIEQQLASALLNELQDKGHLEADTDVMLRQLCNWGEQPREMLERIAKGMNDPYPEIAWDKDIPKVRESMSYIGTGGPYPPMAEVAAAMGNLKRVIFDFDCEPCPDCEDYICPKCNTHLAECPCPGPTQEDDYYYHQIDGLLFASPKTKD